MTAPFPDLEAFHVGLVVRDVDAAMDVYRRMLRIERWLTWEREFAASPFDPRITATKLKIAYGRGGRQTFELIQVLEGWNQHSAFLEAHGEGVQHIGFWTSDVRAAVRSAVDEGARVVWGFVDEQSQAVVQLTPGASAEAIVNAVDPGRITYVDPGLTGVQFEFCGPALGSHIRDFLAEEYRREGER